MNREQMNKVSVLVPIYGVELYIKKCAHSLFSQTFSDIEYVFVNDCTKDSSVDILNAVLAEYPERKQSVSIIHHQQNRGVAAARQTAIDAATSEYILFVDSDDYIELEMVELLYNKAIDTCSDIVFCPFFNEYIHGQISVFNKVFADNKVDLINISLSGQPAFWNKMIRREILVSNSISILEGLNYGEDLCVMPQLIYFAQRFAYIDKPLYHYVQYNANSYTTAFTNQSLNDTFKVIGLLDSFFQNKPDFILYEKSLFLLKSVRKAKVLRSGRVNDDTIRLFPEINSHLSELNLDLKTRIILILASYKLNFMLKLFVGMLKK